MTKFVIALIAVGAAGGSAGANARQIDPGCCGPLSPTVNYRTVQPQRSYTRYRDVSVTHHVNQINRVVDVTRIRPIIRIHEITRVYHHTIVQPINAYEYGPQTLPSTSYVSQPLPSMNYVYPSFGYSPGCGCTW